MANKAVAVITGDVHYNLHTLEKADKAMRQAIDLANQLNVPLVVNGDLHDTKANLRAECVNAMIETFKTANVRPIVNVGNHDLINEKGAAHSLHFLEPFVKIVDQSFWGYEKDLGVHIIPYHNDINFLASRLKLIEKGTTLIMHQGVQGAALGEYVIDKTSLPKECFSQFRVIASHYHPRQDIRCGGSGTSLVGLFSYIGNPYSLGFGEANDPEKGIHILMDDGSLQFVPTNLPRHKIIETSVSILKTFTKIGHTPMNDFGDSIWVKLTGSAEELAATTRQDVQNALGLGGNFKLDKIPLGVEFTEVSPTSDSTSRGQIFDSIIDGLSGVDTERKERLKGTWKKLLTEE